MTPTPARAAVVGQSFEWEAEADLVVIGGGVAGLTAARTASLRGLRVLTLSKGGATDTSTQYAQGGIAVVAPEGDSVESHVQDTVEAGAGLCRVDAVRSIVEGGQDAVAALTDLGAVFDLGRDGQISRTREGGHSTRRIIHAGGDATGAEVQRALNAAGLPVLFGAAAGDIVTGPNGVQGVVVVSDKGFGVVHTPAVLLATGGLGQLYALSTNPPGATADGVALALWAGAAVADLEFVQFHPTVLYTPGGLGRRPLISEAVRGEGGILVDSMGDSVTAGLHPRGDLAPRDVVSRAIAARMRALGTDHVYLDARAIDGFAQRFPTITASCHAAGLDPASDLIPVAPAAHYQCGGVVTDPHGRTAVPGLYAAGEVARTGLHGANRLASNSLLEGLVVGERVGVAAAERRGVPATVAEIPARHAETADRRVLQQLMTEHASVVRDRAGLDEAIKRMEDAVTQRRTLSADGTFDERVAGLEDAALTLAARTLLLTAATRTESRGCHTRSDHPHPDDRLRLSFSVRLDPTGRPQLGPPA
ncbi:L-aspartate oxidase [Nocardia brasiliensis]|uniref:L-aspartate oxidase n=1 Tax=Nocardia brasiliensis (strain ATCC 700358 / HUJEG-1) TaxID=1133849 RepID=K0ESE8_NOCB7|nr:L-aspartate oxidase [Nocardia brasiliensis]AFU00402.1 L-aspartate oxidase [Nocardia brasiliensis ATCC 700358]OCF83711.1 L-aspartate oxidase [Nocardia brasiliensis]